MNTVEDFENAPIGATATDADGNRAMKTDLGEWCWVFQNGDSLDDELMERRGYTLDSPAPTSAREALDLAWELAHPVKEGQVIPKGTRYVRHSQGGRLATFTATEGWTPTSRNAEYIRTLEPLPDPEPDWIDAPAVLARLEAGEAATEPEVWTPVGSGMYARAYHDERTHWSDLRRVFPLYPKEGQDA